MKKRKSLEKGWYKCYHITDDNPYHAERHCDVSVAGVDYQHARFDFTQSLVHIFQPFAMHDASIGCARKWDGIDFLRQLIHLLCQMIEFTEQHNEHFTLAHLSELLRGVHRFLQRPTTSKYRAFPYQRPMSGVGTVRL